MQGSDVLTAAATVVGTLDAHVDADWSVPVPELDFTVASVLAHASGSALFYSVDLWADPADWTGPNEDPFEARARTDVANRIILGGVTASARTLAAAIDAAPFGTRGVHPFGSPDPAGFAAMACDELLVHGNDAARGLGVAVEPDRDIAARVLARLYPWHSCGPDEDPWVVLLWANGRLDLPSRPTQQRWRWHSAPLDEWDGQPPGVVSA
jgi:hypothetical protein